MQMLCGGGVLFLVGTVTGEWTNFNVAEVSLNSWLGLSYLIIFGSLIAFTAYSWLLKNVQPALVATYAYVNPVIAVILGWAIAGESLTGQMLVGAGVIVGSVVLITSENKGGDSAVKKEIHESATANCAALSAST
jgi:drug/metabolite transporter (DMT)-like permease